MKGRFIFFFGVFCLFKARAFYELVNALKLSYTPVFLPSLLPPSSPLERFGDRPHSTAQAGLDSVVLLFHPPV